MDAQKITFQEAEQYADRLVEKKVLTGYGKDVLLSELREGNRTLRKETILQFCALAFRSEMVDSGRILRSALRSTPLHTAT